jgi:hypothetical protein
MIMNLLVRAKLFHIFRFLPIIEENWQIGQLEKSYINFTIKQFTIAKFDFAKLHTVRAPL